MFKEKIKVNVNTLVDYVINRIISNKYILSKNALNERRIEKIEHQVAKIEKTLTSIDGALRRANDLHADSNSLMMALTNTCSKSTLLEVEDFLSLYQFDMLTTVERIKAHKLSYARFGDGELRLIYHISGGPKFQKHDPTMAKDLIDILSMKDLDPTRIMIGLPDRMRGVLFWNYTWTDFWPDLKRILSDKRKYGNSQSTRPDAFRIYGDDMVKSWRSVWDGENPVIITGEGSRFDMHPALFSNLKGHEFIYSLPQNAYSDLNRIIDQVTKSVDVDRMCLVSLGPAGTVLTARLAKLGYWCIDIGHLSSSYSRIYENGPRPEALPLSKIA